MTQTPPYPEVLLRIDNRWATGSDNNFKDVLNPATGLAIGRVACASKRDLEEVAQAAHRAFAAWREVPALQRQRLMHKAAHLLRDRVDHIAHWLTLEQGKPLAEAKAEILMAAEIIEWFADEGARVQGRLVPARMPHVDQRVLKQPVGVVAAFTPWNFPINQVVRKLCAALATGCTIIIKAAEETPASAAELVRTFLDAGAPDGVINLVYGDPTHISQYLISHPQVSKVSFTGSTAVGKQLAALSGAHMKRMTMELGGHAPVIVAQDANPIEAVQSIAAAKFRNAGQICACPTRFLVHRSIQNAFVEAFASYANSLTVGHGLEPHIQMGPLANPRRVKALQHLTEDALTRGAQLVTGGRTLGTEGNFFAPTLINEAPVNSALWNDEPFGPVAAVRGFDQLEDAIAEANRLPYGLAAYAFTHDAATQHTLINRLEAGVVWINHAAPAWPEMPFGGVKDSGIGSEGGIEALEPYLVTKAVSILHVTR